MGTLSVQYIETKSQRQIKGALNENEKWSLKSFTML